MSDLTGPARKYRINPAIFRALVMQESGDKQSARSPAGAIGKTQLMPATARGLGVNPYNEAQNLEGGAKYLRQQLDRFDGDYTKALAAYNAGPGAVQKYGGVPPYAETQHYVKTILRNAKRFGAGSPSPVARTATANLPGTDNSAARAAAVMQFLGSKGGDPVDFALQIRALRDQPGQRVSAPASAKVATVDGSVHSPVARRAKVIGTPHAGTHTLGNWQSDNAVDIAVPQGTPMVALQDGVVVKVRQHPQDGGRFAGDQITVRGANGNEYFYAHGVARVKPGQRIRRGQVLGRTGSANGVPHLHFGQLKGDPRQHT